VGLYFRHRSSLEHDTGPHPENATRIQAIERRLDDAGWPGLELVEAPLAEREWLTRVHSPGHVDRIEAFCAAGGGAIDADTFAVEDSWEAALRAAGAAATGAERLLAGDADFAFCAMRPPGHHAETSRAMGFCLFNSIAIAAAHAIDACEAGRVLILDWDVHHGNGTAEIFDARDDVLFASIHQSPLYPGTGHPREVGSGEGEGWTINLPVAAGAGGEDFLALLEHVVAPIARAVKPGLIAVSAGYDAHADDPLANCELTEFDYAALASTVKALGDELSAPVLVCLEGGYDVDALAASVLATVRALASPRAPDPTPIEPTEGARRGLGRYWPGLLP